MISEPSRELKNWCAHMWRNYKSLRVRFGRWGVRALEALNKFNSVNNQLCYHVYIYYFSRAGYERSLINHYADEPMLFHSYIWYKKRGRMAVGPLKLPCGNLVNCSYEMAKLLVDTVSSVFVEGVP